MTAGMPNAAWLGGRRGWGTLAAIILLCAATRLFGLMALPQFLDESWHISWSLKVSAGMSLVRPWLAGRIVPVAAGAVVTRDVMPGTLVGGVPAVPLAKSAGAGIAV